MRSRPCVRCGSQPRWEHRFLCETCFKDPQQRHETDEAVARQGLLGARRYLVETFHWIGKWGPRSEV